MPHYLNNCRNRNHAAIFGAGAFYDLGTSGRQAANQFAFHPGHWCVVATEPTPGIIRFTWYRFTESRLAMDGQQQVRVLCGVYMREESVQRADAPAMEQYKPFFNKDGHFKRQSVISV